jgi:hypothetical protein
MNLRQFIHETRAALATPIDFADLERHGVLKRAKGGWYALLQPKELPAYAWQQVTNIRSSRCAFPMLKFKTSRTGTICPH